MSVEQFFIAISDFVWQIVAANWLHFVFWGIVALVAYNISKKILTPYVLPYYKELIGIRPMLREMKEELEAEYEEYHWNSERFCKAYLALYSAYRELRTMAKRDHRGSIDPKNRDWSEFDDIALSRDSKKGTTVTEQSKNPTSEKESEASGRPAAH